MKSHCTYLDPTGVVHYAADMADKYNTARYTMCERQGTTFHVWGDRELFTTAESVTCLPCALAGDWWNGLHENAR